VKNIINVGVPLTLKKGDNRVSLPPFCINELLDRLDFSSNYKLNFLIEDSAGKRASYSNENYQEVGAEIVDLENLLKRSDILVDVKQRPQYGIASGKINVFYAHVEKGQGIEQLRALLNAGNVTAYSPETCKIQKREGETTGYYSGVGGARLLMEGIKLSYQIRTPGKDSDKKGAFHFFPSVEGSDEDMVHEAYEKIGSDEKKLKIAIFGGENGRAATGAREELEQAGIGYDLLYKDVTNNPQKLLELISNYDGIINATQWKPGNSRIITKEILTNIKEGAVLADITCDPDLSSTKDCEGNPIQGGVRYTFESRWGEPNKFYWVGPENHTFDNSCPLDKLPNTHVLYNTVGMIPGGLSTAKRASYAYFNMVSDLLVEIIQSLAYSKELPTDGLIINSGKIFHPELRRLVPNREDLIEFKPYL
jgi:alanine dehydrogenase